MPRYFFDLIDHDSSTDEEGIELPGDDRARVEAVQFMGHYLHDHPEISWQGEEIRVVVRDESDAILFTVVTLAIACQ